MSVVLYERLKGMLADATIENGDSVLYALRLVKTAAQPGVEWNRNLYGAGILDAAAVLASQLPDDLLKDQAA